jgi:hypothetical protein
MINKKCINCQYWNYKGIVNLFYWLSPYYGICKIQNNITYEYETCNKFKFKGKIND